MLPSLSSSLREDERNPVSPRQQRFAHWLLSRAAGCILLRLSCKSPTPSPADRCLVAVVLLRNRVLSYVPIIAVHFLHPAIAFYASLTHEQDWTASSSPRCP